MNFLQETISVVSGAESDVERSGPASRISLIVSASVVAVVCSALYGLAVGATPAGLGLSNALKVPIVVVLSGLFALPMALLLLQIVGRPIAASQLWLSQASGTLTASLVLAAVSPMVGLFYYTSDGFGGIMAVGAGGLAMASGVFVFLRAVKTRVKPEQRAAAFVPVAALLVFHALAVIQLIAATSPILPEVTPFAQGLDVLAGLK